MTIRYGKNRRPFSSSASIHPGEARCVAWNGKTSLRNLRQDQLNAVGNLYCVIGESYIVNTNIDIGKGIANGTISTLKRSSQKNSKSSRCSNNKRNIIYEWVWIQVDKTTHFGNFFQQVTEVKDEDSRVTLFVPKYHKIPDLADLPMDGLQ